MPTALYKTGLFISSFFPLYILLLINNFHYFNSVKKLKDAYIFVNLNVSIFLLVIIILIIVSIISLISIISTKQNERHIFSDIVKTEDNILSYIVMYLLPLLSINISHINSLLVNGL